MSKRALFLAATLFFLSSNLFGKEVLKGYVYKDAVDLREIRLSNGHELAYRLVAIYPAPEIMDWYKNILNKENFVQCDSSIPEWQSYLEKRDVRRIARFDRNGVWVNKKLRKFAILILNYTNHTDNSLKPDNSNLAVSFQLIHAKSEKEFIDGLSSLDSSNCLYENLK